MRRKQTGITFIGWICLLIPVAIVGYAVIRLVPIYMNYTRVSRSMEQVAGEAKVDASTGTVNPAMVHVALEKRLDIEGIEYPELKDFVIRRDGKGFFLDINYEDPVPFIANVELLVKFQKSVPIGDVGD